jgi:CRISPR-associated protein Cmr2
MSEMLMKVQVGPVQEFIAQARSTRDMWAGSYLLSRLTARAMEVFDAAGCGFVFPTLEGQPLYEMVTRKQTESDDPEAGLIPTLPNVFLVQALPAQVRELADKAEAAIHEELRELGNKCWSWMREHEADSDWKKRWDAQLAAFPSITWHAVEEQGSWSETVGLLDEQLAARRNTRDFKQWGFVNGQFDETLSGSSKDVLSGKEEIIGDEAFWRKIQNDPLINKAGPLGAINLVKRLFPHCCFPGTKAYWEHLSMEDTRYMAQKNEKPANPYIAVLALDGDRMGAALKKLSTKGEHTAFSQTLARYAEQQVKPLVGRHGGQLAYAGGDDVFAMCPADKALDLAEALRDEFIDTMKNYIDPQADEKLDASCGIAVGHYQFPLQRMVEEARAAEHRAKNERGRAAFEIALLKRSGETLHWGGKWASKALDVYRDFTAKTAGEDFSGRFPYALAELLHPYRLSEKTDVNLRPIIAKEFLHVQERQALRKGAMVEGINEYLAEIDRLEDFPNLFLASAFMNRERGDD